MSAWTDLVEPLQRYGTPDERCNANIIIHSQLFQYAAAAKSKAVGSKFVMKVRHRVRIVAICPVNGDTDTYLASFYPTTLLYCEDIMKAVTRFTDAAVTQEELTQGLATHLGCTVRTIGTNCKGVVETTVICQPERFGA